MGRTVKNVHIQGSLWPVLARSVRNDKNRQNRQESSLSRILNKATGSTDYIGDYGAFGTVLDGINGIEQE